MDGRTIVLGGGGVTGIAWEVGVLNGLAAAGADLSADLVLGTSAGSFVGAALASGADLGELYEAQQRENPDEDAVRLDQQVCQEWVAAYRDGAGDPARIGRAFGEIATRNRPAVSAERRRQTVATRLATEEFPSSLRVAAQDAESGAVRAFSAADGCPLIDVVSASGSVPGISPAVEMLGRTWIDGGMVSSANVGLAEGAEEVLVIAPLPVNHGGVPSAAEELEALASPRHRHRGPRTARAGKRSGPTSTTPRVGAPVPRPDSPRGRRRRSSCGAEARPRIPSGECHFGNGCLK